MGKKFEDVIDMLDDGEPREIKKGFGLALRELDDGRFRIGVVQLGGGGEEMELGYLDDSECAEMFSMLLQLMASDRVEMRTPTAEEVEHYFGKGK